MRHAFKILLICTLLSTIATAQQTFPKAELYGGYSYVNIDTNGISSRQSANGWEAAVTGYFTRSFGVEFDGSGFYKTYSADLSGVSVSAKVTDYSYVAGPRLNIKPVFIHALLGGDHLTGSSQGVSESQDGLAGAFGGGVEQRVSGRWSIRVSADYVFTRHNIFGGPSYTQNNFRAGAGIVYSFGGRADKQPVAVRQGGESPRPREIANSMRLASLGVIVRKGSMPGAEIVDVTPHGPAAGANLRPGNVINSVDGKHIADPTELAAELINKAPGTKVSIGFVDRYWQLSSTVILGQ